MKKLLDIGRDGGFPLCAETLTVLNENSEMLAGWLKLIPLKNRQAVRFGDWLLVCQGFQKRVVKVGAVSAASANQCRLEFRTVTHGVHDGNGNTIADVWREELADIVDEPSPAAQWTLLAFWDVFELKLWYDGLPSFEAGLPGATLSPGSFVSPLALYGDDNMLYSNDERVRIRIALTYTVRARTNTVLSIPLPCECPDGTRMEADLEVVSTHTHYPVRVYVKGGELLIDIGRWLKDEGLYEGADIHLGRLCNDIIRINREVLL